MKKIQNNTFPLSLPNYERIFRILHSVILNESVDISKSCLYFSFFGAAILNKHFDIVAKPIAGLSIYKLDPSIDVFALGLKCDGNLSSSKEGFHCWVQAEDWIVDFMSPLFSEMWQKEGNTKQFERKMFQKPLSDMAASPSDIINAGDFFNHPNLELTQNFIKQFLSIPIYSDLAYISVKWFKKFPKKIRKSIGIGSSGGGLKSVSISRLRVTGAW